MGGRADAPIQYLGLLLLLALPAAVPASVETRLDVTADRVQPLKGIGHLRAAPDEQLTPETILDRGRQGELAPLTTTQFRYTEDVIWLYVPLDTEGAGERVAELQHPILGDVRVWQYDGEELVDHARGGLLVHHDDWPHEHRHFSFPFELSADPDRATTLIYRVETHSSMQVPLVIWERGRFADAQRDSYLVLGLFYGLILALLLYNLLLYLGLRDINYLIYASYVAAYLISQVTLTGLGFQFLWPGAATWAQMAVPMGIAGAYLTALAFSVSFLEVRRYMPVGWRAIQVFIGMFFVVILLTLLGELRAATQLAAVLAITGAFVIIGMGVRTWQQGQHQARYFLLAWTAFMIGVGAFAARALGLAPDIFLTEYGMPIGMALKMLLLSFALADRMRLIQEESNRVQREAQEMLEQRVAERTEELDRKNRVFETLVTAHQAVTETDDINRMLSHQLAHMGQSMPELGLAVVARAPNRPKVIAQYAFHQVPESDREGILEKLRGEPLTPGVAHPVERWLPGREGILLPLHHQLKRLEGYFIVLAERPLDQTEFEAMRLSADHVGATLEAMLLRRELEHVANTDSLTGIRNRTYFDDLIAQAIEDVRTYPPLHFSVAMLDLNGLKPINDEYGHSAGDAMLQAFVTQLQADLRDSDHLVRWGGDEFLIFCPGTTREELEALEKRLTARNGQMLFEYEHEEGTLRTRLTFAFGGASSSEVEPEKVVPLADERMYEAKAQHYARRRGEPTS